MATLGDFDNIFNNTPGDPLNKPDADKLMANFQKIRTFLNSGSLDGNNMFASASPGELLVANSSGTITAVAMSGDVTIADDGETTIADGTIAPNQLGLASGIVETEQSTMNINLLNGSWADLVSVTPAAGTYLMYGQIIYTAGVTNNGVFLKFSTDSLPRSAEWFSSIPLGPSSVGCVPAKVTLDGVTAFKLQGQKQVASANANDVQSGGTGFSAGTTKLTRVRIG